MHREAQTKPQNKENLLSRTKVISGFGEINSAKSIMKNYEIYYNFTRKH